MSSPELIFTKQGFDNWATGAIEHNGNPYIVYSIITPTRDLNPCQSSNISRMDNPRCYVEDLVEIKNVLLPTNMDEAQRWCESDWSDWQHQGYWIDFLTKIYRAEIAREDWTLKRKDVEGGSWVCPSCGKRFDTRGDGCPKCGKGPKSK